VPSIKAFREGLAQLVYLDGQNIAVEYRYAEGKLGFSEAGRAEINGEHSNVAAVGNQHEINMVFSTVLDATEHVKNKAAKKLEAVKEGKPIE